MDAAETRDWYAGTIGQRAARRLRAGLEPLLRRGPTSRLLTLGAPPALLRGIDPAGFERIAAMGALPHWPADGGNVALAADACHLPFAEAVFDQALVIHCLEIAERPAAVLRELWRVLAPAGELLLVVPNRAGLWALSEANPFGQGRPYGRGALGRTLADAMFEPDLWRHALAAPPLTALGWAEPLLARTLPGLSGVHIVRAAKRDGLAPVAGRVRTARAVAPAYAARASAP